MSSDNNIAHFVRVSAEFVDNCTAVAPAAAAARTASLCSFLADCVAFAEVAGAVSDSADKCTADIDAAVAS